MVIELLNKELEQNYQTIPKQMQEYGNGILKLLDQIKYI